MSRFVWVIKKFDSELQPLVDSVIAIFPRGDNNSIIHLLNHYFVGTLPLHNFLDEPAKGRMRYWDTLTERIVPSFNAIIHSWKVMLEPVEDIPTPDRKWRLTTNPEARCSNLSCFEIVNVSTQALHIFVTERGHEVLETLRNILRRNKRQCLEAFCAKGVLGIFSEPLLQREGPNSPEVALTEMKKAAQNFCSSEAGRKSVTCSHFKANCYRFLGLLLVAVVPTIENSDYAQPQICSLLQRIQAEEWNFDWPMRVSCISDNQVAQHQMYRHKTNWRSCSVDPDSFETQTCKTRSDHLPRERRFLPSVSYGGHRLDQGSPNFFVRGPHKLLYNSSMAGHLT